MSNGSNTSAAPASAVSSTPATLTAEQCREKLDAALWRLNRMYRVCDFVTSVAAGAHPNSADINAESVMEMFSMIGAECNLVRGDLRLVMPAVCAWVAK
jgi:hypothetical protein